MTARLLACLPHVRPTRSSERRAVPVLLRRAPERLRRRFRADAAKARAHPSCLPLRHGWCRGHDRHRARVCGRTRRVCCNVRIPWVHAR
jgi:hypothetical protein